MSFDVTLQPMAVDIITPDPENVPAGESPMITQAITIGLVLPFQQAPGQPLVVPLGVVRVPFTPGIAKQVGEKMAEDGAKFPEKPNIDIANSLQGVDQVVAADRQMRGR